MNISDVVGKLKKRLEQGANSVSSFVNNPVRTIQTGIQNFSMNNQSNPLVKWGSSVQSDYVPFMNQTITLPKSTAQTPLFQSAPTAALKYGLIPQAENVIKGVQSYAKMKAPAVYGKPTIEDYGNMAGGYGAATNPLSSIVGGGFSTVMKAGENYLNKKPITQGLDTAYREGFDFQSKLGPISEGSNIALRPILSKLNPTGMQSWNTYINLAKNPNISQAAKAKAWGLLRNAIVRQVGEKALSGFVGMGAFGATMPAKNWEERLKNTIDQGVQGAIFEGGQRIVGQGANVIGKQVLKPLIQDVGKNRKGFFAGQNALGFNDASRKFSSLADKKLRFEVSDRQSYLKRNAIEPSKERGVVQLQDIFQHEGLWRQYPEFKKLRVSFEDLGNAKGSFNENTFTLSINKNMSPSEMRSTILHEVQHAVQAREGFARGGSVRQVGQDINKLWTQLDFLNGKMKESLNKGDSNAYNYFMNQRDKVSQEILKRKDEYGTTFGGYKRLAGEIESRDVQARMNLSPEQRKYTQPYASQGIPLKDQIVRMDGNGSSSNIDTVAEKAAIKAYKTTNNPKTGAFITSDGEMIDGSGKVNADPSSWPYMNDYRSVDHREIAMAGIEKMKDIPNGTQGSDALIHYMNRTGNIRMSMNGNELNLDVVGMPNKQQLDTIRKIANGKTIVADISDAKGYVKASGDFKNIGDYINFLKQNLNENISMSIDGIDNRPFAAKTPQLTLEQQAASKKLPGIMYSTSKTKAEGRVGKQTEVPPWEVPGFNGGGDGGSKPPSLTKDDINNLAGIAQFKSDNDKQKFKGIFAKWIGRKEAAKTIGVETGSDLQLPKDLKGEDVIKAIESPYSKAPNGVDAYIQNLRTKYDELIKEANKQGIKTPYRQNYITHIWEGTPEQVAQAYQVLKQKFGFSGERKIPTYEEGIKIGKMLEAQGQPNPFIPKYTNPAQIISEYTRRLEQTKANLDFIKELKQEGFIVSKRVSGFEPITAPGFVAPTTQLGDETIREGVYYAPKEVAQAINSVFNEQNNGVLGQVVSKAANISGKIQDISMSGGVPGTPVNAWTSAQIIKELTAGRVKGPLKALWIGLTEGGSNKYFKENVQAIKEQQLNNVPISTTFNTESLAKGETIKRTFGEQVARLWNKAVNEPTFKRFMPVLQTEFFKDVKTQALKAGRSEQEAVKIAAEATKNFYGLTSTADQAVRNKLGGDLASTFFFAPKYRESMFNFWGRSIKGLKKPLALENMANTKFLVGATLTAIAYDQLNRRFNNGRSILDNPPGTEDKLLIPIGNGQVIGIPFLSSIATMPRAIFRQGKALLSGDVSGAAKDALQTYSSMGIRPIADVISNEDYYGKSITQDNMTGPEKVGAIGGYLFKQYVGAHPYVKELVSSGNWNDPAWQRLSRAMELPLRYYEEKGLNSKYYYGAKDNAIKGLNDIEKQAFNAIPKPDTNDPNTRILKYQIYLTYPSVFEAKQKIELETAAKTGKAIDPLYLVNYDTAKKYMRYEALPEGSQDRKAMTKAYPELLALFDTRSKYFNENPINNATSSQRPTPSAYVQQQMNAKNWNDPQVREYLDANTAWNNDQREKLGLPPLAGYGFGPKKIKISSTLGKTKLKKLKIKQSKTKNIKIKFAKMKNISTVKAKTIKVKNIADVVKKIKLSA